MAEQDWLDEALFRVENFPDTAIQLRERAMSDLAFFARLVNPGYMYGQIHLETFGWMGEYSLYRDTDDGLTSNKLIMFPRAHLKSHMVAVWCAWMITRHPEITIFYVSATAGLAKAQLFAIKNILESREYTKYFPEYVHPDKGLREKWSSEAIMIDHPKREKESVRDATVAIAGLTTNTTGWHADVIIGDDVVVPENAYTEGGRQSVSDKVSQFTSIRNTGGFTMACGTRYHPNDIYAVWKDLKYPVFNDEGLIERYEKTWDIREYAVEENGLFLWPRASRDDGKAFGFNQQTLARIESEYLDKTQFKAQYYNDPNDPSTNRMSDDNFQYLNERYLKRGKNGWEYNGRKLNIYAAVDFAFSLSKAADYTAIVVIGIDYEGNIYVLDIDRFKSDKTYEYFKHIASLHSKWGFNKLRAEVTVAQKVIVNSIKDHMKGEGMLLPVEEYRPSRHEGSKEERISATLEHLYLGMKVFHTDGGHTSSLEEELKLARPKNDDIKDALASAVAIAVKPGRGRSKDDVKELLQRTGTNRFNRRRR